MALTAKALGQFTPALGQGGIVKAAADLKMLSLTAASKGDCASTDRPGQW